MADPIYPPRPTYPMTEEDYSAALKWYRLVKFVEDCKDPAAVSLATAWAKVTGNAPIPVPAPIPMRLHCPNCGALHIDTGKMATEPHRTHACQNCGMLWAPAVVPTVGVEFLPGCKNEDV